MIGTKCRKKTKSLCWEARTHVIPLVQRKEGEKEKEKEREKPSETKRNVTKKEQEMTKIKIIEFVTLRVSSSIKSSETKQTKEEKR